MTIAWSREFCSLTNVTGLYNTISVHFYCTTLKHRIESIIQSCDVCQRTKLSGPGYGQLPPRDALVAPWFEVAVDLIGPWNVTIRSRVFTLHHYHVYNVMDEDTVLTNCFQITY